MELMSAIATIPGVGPYIPYLVALGVICAAIATVLPAPAGPGVYATIYAVVNWLGLNFGKAKNAAKS